MSKKVDLSKYKLSNKRQILRNAVLPKIGLAVLESAIREKQLMLN
jgi:hypothetical protein